MKKRPTNIIKTKPTKYTADIVLTFDRAVSKSAIKDHIRASLGGRFGIRRVTVRSVDFD